MIFISFILLTGCFDLPGPETVIIPPTVFARDVSELETILDSFIDDEFVVFTRERSGERFDIIDVAGEEGLVIGFFGVAQQKEAKGFVVIKKTKTGYEKVFRKQYQQSSEYGISSFQYMDIIKDNKKELIIEHCYLQKPKKITIYSFNSEYNDDNGHIIYVNEEYTIESNRYELIINDTDKPALAIWINIKNDIFYIEVIKWIEQSFEQVTYNYPQYYKQLLPNYRRNALDGLLGAVATYYYSDILMKAGEYELALEWIDEYLSVDNYVTSLYRMKSQFIKGKCLYELGKTKEALDALLESGNENAYYLDKRLEANLLLCEIYVSKNEKAKADMLIEESMDLLQSFRVSDYKYKMWLNMFTTRLGL